MVKQRAPEDRPLKLIEHPVWVVATPAEDVQDEWLLHCLDLNVMTQGRSLSHALDMMVEAVGLVLDEDSKAGLNPFDRVAPQEVWTRFADDMRHSELTNLDELLKEADDGQLSWMATQLELHLVVEETRKAPQVQRVAQAAIKHAGATA